MKIIDKIKWHYCYFLKHQFPFIWSKRLYRILHDKTTDFNNPKDLNEKIQWLMFYTDTALWTELADKYKVRQYVSDRIGKKYLIPLLGKWDKSSDIDFDILPDRFVIKPNNGSYDTIICKSKSDANLEEIRKKMEHSLTHKFGYENAEPHYLNIPPCVIAEEMLECNDTGGLIDYKIWCFNGKPYCIFVCANRDNVHHTTDFCYYDLNWVRHNEYITEKYHSDFECPRPENLEELLDVATKLSAGIPQVRVDLYDVNGRIYFGEMTMSSNFGMMPYFTQEALIRMGNEVALPERNLKEKFSTFVKRWLPRF